MASTYMTKDIIKSLDNKELIKKSEDIEIKISKASVSKISQDIINDMITLQQWIDDEIDARLDDGRMDEDELDEDL